MGSPWPRKSQRVAALSSTLSACSRTPLFGNAKALCGSTCLSCYSHTELRVTHSHGLLVVRRVIMGIPQIWLSSTIDKIIEKKFLSAIRGVLRSQLWVLSRHIHSPEPYPVFFPALSDHRASVCSVKGGPTYRGGGGRARVLSL